MSQVVFDVAHNPRIAYRRLGALARRRAADTWVDMTATATDPHGVLQAILTSIANGADHFGMLQLDRSAGEREVREAYFRLAKVVHPDLPAFIANPKLRADATRAFQAITLAHATLSDPNKRLAYTSGIETAKQQRIVQAMTAPVSAARAAETQVSAETARIYFARGKQAAQRREWQAAQDALQLALKWLEGAELAEAQLNLGWAILNNPQASEVDKVAKVKELLFAVVAASPKSHNGAQAHYYLGVWNKFHGDMREAAKHFDGCLAISPGHIEARREKMILERRRGPEPAKGKPLSGATSSKTVAKAATGPQPAQKVGLEKKPTLLERLFGKKG